MDGDKRDTAVCSKVWFYFFCRVLIILITIIAVSTKLLCCFS